MNTDKRAWSPSQVAMLVFLLATVIMVATNPAFVEWVGQKFDIGLEW